MWEHAYYLQHQNLKGDWVKAFWKLVNGDDLGQRLRKVRTLHLGL
jgi:Fe-Mn family superoxide dismutase